MSSPLLDSGERELILGRVDKEWWWLILTLVIVLLISHKAKERVA